MDINKGFALVLDSKRHKAYFRGNAEPWRPAFPNHKDADTAWAIARALQDELRSLGLKNNLTAPEIMAKVAERIKNEL